MDDDQRKIGPLLEDRRCKFVKLVENLLIMINLLLYIDKEFPKLKDKQLHRDSNDCINVPVKWDNCSRLLF